MLEVVTNELKGWVSYFDPRSADTRIVPPPSMLAAVFTVGTVVSFFVN